MGTARHRGALVAVALAAVLVAVVVVALVLRRSTSDEPTGAVAPLAAGASSQRLDVDGRERSYRAYRPTGLAAAAPLVLVLHGGGGSARQAEEAYGWTEVAEREGFVVVHPEGVHRAWNTDGGCCGRAAAQDVDDVAFLTQVVDDVAQRVDVDPDRVFVTGMSNGAIMAYTLACRTDVFAAVAPVAGTMLVDCPDPAPISVFHLHGTEDTAVRMDGSPGERAGIVGPPVADVVGLWRSVDRCLEPSVVVDAPVRRSVSGCADGRSVELVTVDGAGHQWPGSEVRRPAADAPYPGLDATENIWRFFAAHPRP
ncbi:alpha/beta hydrolase family esterase [Blastococcus litoris]|uniref:alpha/beta hydrolase family esterase n=1 Tax=Blastococcus litoris TaxID=2171622 RepID=UPI000E2FFDFA|nr:PHB depolymerase family esterase [Blastococcus litoris]